MGKYSDIRRGKELNAALEKLRAYEDLTRAEKQALYKGQRGSSVKVSAKRVKGYVESFGLVGRLFLPVKLLSSTQTTNASLISIVRTATAAEERNHAFGFTVPAGGATLDGMKGYAPARLSLTDRGAEVADNKSRITDVAYKRYDNKTVSSPFGSRTGGTETYDQAVSDIGNQSTLATFLETEGNRIAFTPEIL